MGQFVPFRFISFTRAEIVELSDVCDRHRSLDLPELHGASSYPGCALRRLLAGGPMTELGEGSVWSRTLQSIISVEAKR